MKRIYLAGAFICIILSLLVISLRSFLLLDGMKTAFVIIWEVLATSFFFWAIWQHDLICCPPIWGEGWCHSQGAYANDHFKCFIWETTIGTAYDVTLTVEYVAFWMGILGILILL